MELEAAPQVWRLQERSHEVPSGCDVLAMDGSVAAVRSAWTDEPGRLFLDTDRGFGIVHTLDMLIAADAVERGQWSPQPLAFEAMPQRFGFVRRPEPEPA